MIGVAIIELLVAVLLALAGFFQWSGAEGFCQQLSRRRAGAHKVVRFLLYPAWFYKGSCCVWQLRLGAIGAMLMGLFVAVVAVTLFR